MHPTKFTLMRADLSLSEVGQGDCEAAIAAFGATPWADLLAQIPALLQANKDCIDPNLTFTAEKVHLTISAKRAGEFHVEVCVPRVKKFLGIFGGVKFYTFSPIGSEKAEHVIRSFMTDTPEAQHEVYSQLSRVAA